MTKLIRIKQVCERRGCCRAQIYRDMNERDFPRPVKIGPRMAAWVEAEVDAWIRAQIAARDGEALNRKSSPRPAVKAEAVVNA